MLEKTFDEKTFILEVLYHIGALENSIHFIFDKSSKTAAVVDPAWAGELFLQKIRNRGFTLSQIWLTHWHPDHTNAADFLALKSGAEILVGDDEAPYLNIRSDFKTVADGDNIHLGGTVAKIIKTPGHTAGGICFLLDNHLLAGDTLFVFGAGHCALPGADAATLFHSLQKLKNLDDEIMLHCGHDYGAKIVSTMGEQKRSNPFLLIDNAHDFVRYRNEIHDKTREYPMCPMRKNEVLALL